MTRRPLQDRAQQMRRQPTPAERAAWRLLKATPFDTWHFRRQVPFGPRYIADFASHRARLVIEIDGDTHDLESAPEQARTAWFASQGYRVLRFTNAEVGEWRLMERTLLAVLAEQS